MRRWLRPHFAALGKGATCFGHRYIEVTGRSVFVGDYSLLFAAPDNFIRLTSWPSLQGGEQQDGEIRIGDYALLTPGSRIGAAERVTLGNSCMMASGAYISDCDWHGIYERVDSIGEIRPVQLHDNVWIGTRAIVCKGVTIGENSIVGAGAVVTSDVPANVVVGGVPAKKVAELDPQEKRKTRADMYADPENLRRLYDQLDRSNLSGNSIFGWLRALTSPSTED